MDTAKWIEWVGRASATSLLGAILLTGYAGVWTWGSELTQMRSERDEWKVLALRATHLAENPGVHAVGMAPPAPTSLEETKDRIEQLGKDR